MRALLLCVAGLAISAASTALAVPPACPGDADGDRMVGLSDMAAIINCWGQPASCDPGADLDPDGTIGLSDSAVVILNWGSSCPLPIVSLELGGNSLTGYPHFEFVQSFNRTGTVEFTIDPSQHPDAVACAGLLYVVADKNGPGWTADPNLVDVRGAGAQAIGPISGVDIQSNRVGINQANLLSSGTFVAEAYDIVLDFNSNGILDGGDYIDGLDSAGIWIVKDLTAAGPLPVTTINYTVTNVTAGFTSERTYYPTAIAGMGQLPLVVISHGNGHQWTWYDYLGTHLASHGYIVMSHQNNTVPGIETASTTTLEHTREIIAQQGTISGGVLNGHINADIIIWFGHSRGGEGVARAYDRIFDGTFIPGNYQLSDIKFISSIAPTDFLGSASANPHGANYHLLYGAADGDVCGCPDNDIADSFNLLERATNNRASTYIHAVDHNDFNCCGFEDYSGPAPPLTRAVAQVITRGYYLALLEYYIQGSNSTREYLWRQYERFRPLSASAAAVVISEFKDQASASKFVIDDFQTNSATTQSSSGPPGSVSFDVLNIFEGVMHDINTNFTWPTVPADPMNGMTRMRAGETQRAVTFDYTTPTPRFMEWALADFNTSPYDYLSMRACQMTRHTETIAELGDLTYTVTLRDLNGVTSSINIGVYGGGIEEPFQRTGFGTGTGWQNALEVVRIRLADFATNGSGIDLAHIVGVRLDLGTGFGSTRGRLGLDDLEFVQE